MSLQQASLSHVPLAQKRAELQKTLARESWAILWPHLDFPLTDRQREQVISSRRAYYTAQEELQRSQ
jgi:hypothetical protein